MKVVDGPTYGPLFMNTSLFSWQGKGPFTLGNPASASSSYSTLHAGYCDAIPAEGVHALAGSRDAWSIVAFEVYAVSIVDAPVPGLLMM
jgi:hypothetical protein